LPVSICLDTANTTSFCTSLDQNIYAQDTVTADHWNYGTNANSGTFGVGKGSVIWTIFGSPTTKLYDIFLAPFTDFTNF
jgi:hypothetical protein